MAASVREPSRLSRIRAACWRTEAYGVQPCRAGSGAHECAACRGPRACASLVPYRAPAVPHRAPVARGPFVAVYGPCSGHCGWILVNNGQSRDMTAHIWLVKRFNLQHATRQSPHTRVCVNICSINLYSNAADTATRRSAIRRERMRRDAETVCVRRSRVRAPRWLSHSRRVIHALLFSPHLAELLTRSWQTLRRL